MMALAVVKRISTRDGKAFSTEAPINLVIFNYYYKEVLEDGSTKEKSIKGKKR